MLHSEKSHWQCSILYLKISKGEHVFFLSFEKLISRSMFSLSTHSRKRRYYDECTHLFVHCSVHVQVKITFLPLVTFDRNCFKSVHFFRFSLMYKSHIFKSRSIFLLLPIVYVGWIFKHFCTSLTGKFKTIKIKKVHILYFTTKVYSFFGWGDPIKMTNSWSFKRNLSLCVCVFFFVW